MILKGESNINESMVTGESIPVDKETGTRSSVTTINGNSSFVMENWKKWGAETMLAQIAKWFKEAQMSKAPIQSWLMWFQDILFGGNCGCYDNIFVWGLVIGAEPAITLITR